MSTFELPDAAGLGEDIGLIRLDHVAVAVADLRAGLALFGSALGGRFLLGGDNDELGIRIVQLGLPGGMKIELITPTRDDAAVARFLQRRGPGVHHMTLLFADVEVAVDRLTAQGYELVDTDLSRPQWRETFVRPRSGRHAPAARGLHGTLGRADDVGNDARRRPRRGRRLHRGGAPRAPRIRHRAP